LNFHRLPGVAKLFLTLRQFHEIFQQLQADLLAFLRVKLRGVNIAAQTDDAKVSP
jgi:hypothetical protein